MFAMLAALCIAAATAANAVVVFSAKRHILPADAAPQRAYDCILVLGCGVTAQGEPTLMLRDRLDSAIELYRAGFAPKILMSGDHGQSDYDEVNIMKRYAVSRGVPECDVFMDHAGFSTYESAYRARDVFLVRRALIVTQRYHLYRAVFCARALGLDADGFCAAGPVYRGQAYRQIREIAARCKDCLTALFHPQPTYLGDAIPIYGDGALTNG